MSRTRLVPAVVIGSLMIGIAFAGANPRFPATPENVLTKEEIMAIEQSCLEKHGKALTSEAYRSCVKSRENAAMAEAQQRDRNR